MNKKNKSNRKEKENAVTLIALVVTIVVLLILAGVSINLVLGDNGIITKAKEKAETTQRVSAEEDMNRLILEYQLAKNNETLEDFLKTKITEGRIDEVTPNNDGTITITKKVDGKEYTITIKDTTSSVKISGIKVVENSDGTGTALGEESVEFGKTLYITFSHSITNGATTVSPSIPYAVTDNGTYTFVVTGTVNGKVHTKTVSVQVNQFKDTGNIYAFLYTDGTLSFENENKPISDKTVSKKYGNIKNKYFTHDFSSLECNTPWFEDADNIKNVRISNTIFPKSVAN